jgi:hypothetical protein
MTPNIFDICGGNLGASESSGGADPGYSPTGTGWNDNYWGCLGQLYDPTNGTVSRGRVYVTNKGFLNAKKVMAGF